jgi:hypothetical protein
MAAIAAAVVYLGMGYCIGVLSELAASKYCGRPPMTKAEFTSVELGWGLVLPYATIRGFFFDTDCPA